MNCNVLYSCVQGPDGLIYFNDSKTIFSNSEPMEQVNYQPPDNDNVNNNVNDNVEGDTPPAPSRKRDAILEAATEMFLDLGYGATSMNALVAKIGGSKATIYAYFTNKQALFEAVAERVLSKHMTALQSNELKSLGLTEGLAVMGQKLLELVTSDHHIRLSRLVIAETPNFPEIGLAYHDRGPALANKQISAFLAPEKNIPNPDKAASHYSAMLLHHVFLARLCGKSTVPSPDAIQALVADAVGDFLKLYDLEQENDT